MQILLLEMERNKPFIFEILTGLICLEKMKSDESISRIYQDASIIGIDPLLISAIFENGLNGQAAVIFSA